MAPYASLTASHPAEMMLSAHGRWPGPMGVANPRSSPAIRTWPGAGARLPGGGCPRRREGDANGGYALPAIVAGNDDVRAVPVREPAGHAVLRPLRRAA